MGENAKLTIGDKSYDFPIIKGAENECAVDISKFRAQSEFITLDPGYGNTGACQSAITFLDGDKGILRYRGYPIEQLAEQSTFVEIAYMLIFGKLPNQKELNHFSQTFAEFSMIHEDMKNFFNAYPSGAHPMAILSAMICSLSGYYPDLVKSKMTPDLFYRLACQLLSQVRTIAAFSYKKSIGQPFVYPRHDLKYVPNFLNMMF
jgi:citrate synthase